MSYTKTNWQTGDTITAEKLNHAEQGIYDNSVSGGVLVVNATFTEESATLDKTWQQIRDADFAIVGYTIDNETGSNPRYRSMICVETEIGTDTGEIISPYSVIVIDLFDPSVPLTFHAETANDYPVLQAEDNQ